MVHLDKMIPSEWKRCFSEGNECSHCQSSRGMINLGAEIEKALYIKL